MGLGDEYPTCCIFKYLGSCDYPVPVGGESMKIQGKTAAEIVNCIRSLTQSGHLLPGDMLPSVRDLAAEIGVNRNTVALAYRSLVTAGIAKTQGRLGTVIRNQYNPGEQEGFKQDSNLIDLASGNPNIDWLPDLNSAFKNSPYKHRLYGAPTINSQLENYIREWFAPDCPASFDVNLTHGAVDAIERLLSAYLVKGDKVAVEDPCFLSSINTLRHAGMQAVGVPTDAEGICVDDLEIALEKGALAVILTPRAHNPTGCSLGPRRARAISRLIAKYPNVLVIIDDHFALLSAADYHSVIPSKANRWALVRSFSKALGPDIRVAAVASDVVTSRHLRARLASGTSWVSHLLQDIVQGVLSQADTTELMSRAKEDYVHRRQILEHALREQNIHFLENGDGLNLWVPLHVDDQGVASDLARRGWLVRHGATFSVQKPVRGLRITISSIDAVQCHGLARDIRCSIAAVLAQGTP